MDERITLVLADDHQAFAEGLGVMLDAGEGFEIVGVAANGAEAVRLVGELVPTVLLLDAHMPGAEVTRVVREAKAAAPQTRVLILSADTRRETVAAVIEAGADGFLAKDSSSRRVAGAIRQLVEADTAPAPPAPLPASSASRDPSVELRVRTLSTREREILGYLAAGWSNRRIAEQCFLSLNTVRTHVQNILVKLGVHSKLEAVAFALEHQVVEVAGRPPAAWASEHEF